MILLLHSVLFESGEMGESRAEVLFMTRISSEGEDENMLLQLLSQLHPFMSELTTHILPAEDAIAALDRTEPGRQESVSTKSRSRFSERILMYSLHLLRSVSGKDKGWSNDE